MLGGLADHGQHVGRGQRLLGLDAGDADLGDRAHPVLELAVEAVLSVAGEELEEAHNQRAGEADQRGGEGSAHAAELAFEAAHQVVEDVDGALALLGRERADGVHHRGNDGGKAVEGTEKAEEDQQIDQIAREVALLLDAGTDGFQDRAGGGRGERAAGPALGKHRGERGEETGRLGELVAGPVERETLDPAHRGDEREDLPEAGRNADEEDDEDEAVQIG